MAIWRMRIADYTPKSTSTHSIYVIIISQTTPEIHTLKNLNKMSQAHRMSRLRHTHRYSSGIINTKLQAGQPWGCGSTFAGTTGILTRQNPH